MQLKNPRNSGSTAPDILTTHQTRLTYNPVVRGKKERKEVAKSLCGGDLLERKIASTIANRSRSVHMIESEKIIIVAHHFPQNIVCSWISHVL
jgi:hypothetical protein